MRQLSLWDDNQLSTPRPSDEMNRTGQPEATSGFSLDLANLPSPIGDDAEAAPPTAILNGLPSAVPLQSAVEAGVFGMSIDGPITPDEEQVEELTAEHANEMIVLLADSQVLEEAIRLECDPATGRTPSTPEAKQSLLAKLDIEWKRLLQAYDDAVAAYAEGFGDVAARSLDQWVRKAIADEGQGNEPYPPSHPWHYFHTGDNAPPIPVDQIEADSEAGRWLAERLPKNPKKRLQAMREMLEREQASLAADKERYVDIVNRGAEALSRYDREIAHTSDAMAVATAFALKYNHITQGLGRVGWLAQELQRLGCDQLPFVASKVKSDRQDVE